jgi:hypothetical protein
MITYSKQENQGDCLETITVAGIRFIERYRHRDGLVQYMHEGNFYMFKKNALGVFLKRNEKFLRLEEAFNQLKTHALVCNNPTKPQ